MFRMAGADPATARRYADEGFEEVLDLDRPGLARRSSRSQAKREAMRAAADALGLATSVASPGTGVSRRGG